MPKLRKSLFAAAALVAGLALPGANAAQAQVKAAAGIPGGPYATSFLVQNLTSTTANCQYQLFNDAGGSAAFTASLPAIGPNANAVVYTPSVTGMPSGTFAGVVSCDQQVAAVVNYSQSTDGTRADAYVGTSNPASTLYVPSAYKNYYNYSTSFRIQDASGAPQTVNIQYFAPGSATPAASQSLPLPANGALTVDQAAISGLTNNVSYSAKISAGGLIATTVNIFGLTGTTVAPQMYAYSAFASGATTWYAPVIMRNYYGYNSATTVQNLSTSTAAQVQVTYSNGTVRNYTIQPNSAQVVLDFNEATLQRNVLYSSKIVSTNSQPLIVTVNESTPSTNRATTYEGISGGSKTQVSPSVLKRYYGFNSSVTCQNIGTAVTNVSVVYKGSVVGGGPVTVNGVSRTIQPGATQLFYQPGETSLPDRFIGSATFTSDTSNIVCVANQDKNEAPNVSTSADFLSAYDTVGQ